MSEYRSLGMRMSPYADITQIRFTGLISAADIRPKHPGIRVNAIIIYHFTGIIQNKTHLENSIIVRHHLHIRQDVLTLIDKAVTFVSIAQTSVFNSEKQPGGITI